MMSSLYTKASTPSQVLRLLLRPPQQRLYTVVLPPGAKAVAEFYDLESMWSAESLERRRIMREKAKAQRI